MESDPIEPKELTRAFDGFSCGAIRPPRYSRTMTTRQLADRQADFDALVLPHLDRLLAFAVRRTDTRSDAEDAVQEACVRAWVGFDELRDAARARAWLYRIARTVLSEMSERSTRRRQL